MTTSSFISGDGTYRRMMAAAPVTTIIDIAALKYMYGATFNSNAGSTVYS